MASLLERLGVNIAAVVIGALAFIIAITWVEAFLAITEYVIFNGGLEAKHIVDKKIFSAIFVSSASGVIAIFIYMYYKSNLGSKEIPAEEFLEDEPDVEDFVALIDFFGSEDSLVSTLSGDE